MKMLASTMFAACLMLFAVPQVQAETVTVKKPTFAAGNARRP